MFVNQLLLVKGYSQLYYLPHAKKNNNADFRYKSLKSWKIDNIDLTQKFTLLIFTYWLLPIFIDWLLRVYNADTHLPRTPSVDPCSWSVIFFDF